MCKDSKNDASICGGGYKMELRKKCNTSENTYKKAEDKDVISCIDEMTEKYKEALKELAK